MGWGEILNTFSSFLYSDVFLYFVLISVNTKYKNTSEYKKLEKVFKIPPQQTASNALDRADIEIPRPLSRVGLRNADYTNSKHSLEIRSNDVYTNKNVNENIEIEAGMENYTIAQDDYEY